MKYPFSLSKEPLKSPLPPLLLQSKTRLSQTISFSGLTRINQSVHIGNDTVLTSSPFLARPPRVTSPLDGVDVTVAAEP